MRRKALHNTYQSDKRYVAMCIPGDDARGAEPAWFVFDRKLNRSMTPARSQREAAQKATELNRQAAAKKPIAVFVAPDVQPHDDPSRIIGLRTTYTGDEHPYLRGEDVVIVAVLKNALCAEEHEILKTDDEIRADGGVTCNDRIEVAPFIREEGRLSFVTSDPRATDLTAFSHLALHEAGARRHRRNQKKGQKP
jgi:hypothetical protein